MKRRAAAGSSRRGRSGTSTPTINDGTITVKIGERAVTIDLLATKLSLETVEEKHGVGAKGWRGTPAFLSDLAAALESTGVSPCTPTAAYQIWCYVSEGWAELKKDMDAMRK